MQNQFGQKYGVNGSFQQFNKFSEAFSQSKPLIEPRDNFNYGNIIHNNIAPTVMSEHIMEYKVHVDSTDRNTDLYPSPFKMKVAFGSAQSAYEPIISRKFKNIKYVTIDSIILPRTVAIDTSQILFSPPSIYPTESAFPSSVPADASSKLHILSNHKYLILKVNELESDKNIGTSALLDRDTFTFMPYTSLGLDAMMWKPLHNDKLIYQNSLLFNLNSLTLSILDSFGNEIKIVDETGKNIVNSNITGINKDYLKYVSENLDDESVAYTNNVTQFGINLTFGVVENEINTVTNY